jgi:hypothetical protein
VSRIPIVRPRQTVCDDRGFQRDNRPALVYCRLHLVANIDQFIHKCIIVMKLVPIGYRSIVLLARRLRA